MYYELGFAHGLGKSVLCIARENTPIHFDVYGFRVLFFSTYRDLESKLSRELPTLLQAGP